MATIQGQPENKNMLSQIGFRFSVKRLPSVSFFASRINMPGLTLNAVPVPTPFKVINMAADKLEYGEFSVTFKVDEDMGNYLEIFDWMVGIGFPTKFDERKQLVANGQNSPGTGIFSDGTLMINSSAKNPNMEVTFIDLLPVSLSDLDFTTQASDVDYLEATVSFKFLYYTITRLKRS